MIGIAGGAGPAAGVDLCKKIIEETQAAFDQEHLPLLLLSKPECIPDRTAYLMGEEPVNPAVAISAVFYELEQAGATVAAIPCNTAHAPAIFNEILNLLRQRRSDLIVVNMIEETIHYLQQIYGNKPVGILCTTGTYLAGIYRTPLSAAGFRVVEPDPEWQQKVHNTIYHRQYGIKTQSEPVHPYATELLMQAASHLIHRGAEIILLACTEIPLAITAATVYGKPVADPGRILAKALVRRFAPGKLKSKLL